MKPLITHLAQATMISAFTMTRRMAVMLLLAMFVVSTTWADGLTGTGRADDPYLISSDADWETFASNVNNGTSYSGKTVKLTANINVSTMAGTSSNKFKGTFDGAGHTINLALTASEDRCAPFRYVEDATISLLTVTGTVSTGTYKFGAGLIAESTGSVTVKNCRSSVTISGDRSSLNDKDGTHGGFVSLESNGSLTFINCLFDGSISGQSATNCGGFVGWRSNGSLTFTNCLMAGTLNIDVNNNSATFNRNGSSTLDNSYYITSYGAVQGTDAGSMSNETLLSNLGSGWELINNKVVPSVNTKNLSLATISGLKRNYLYTGSAISLAYVVKDIDGNTLVSGTHYNVSLTRGGTSVSEVKDNGTYTLTITARDGSGYTGSQSVTFEVVEYVEIGDGTSTDKVLPIAAYYNYSITEQLYTAEEIGTAGTITSISFHYTGVAAKDFPITVYMENVDADDLSTGISLATADQVFKGTFSVPAEDGWVTINLDTPFAYDGTSNLLIGINKGYLYYYDSNTWYHTATGSTMARYTQNDSNPYDIASTVPGTETGYRPNIRIGITPASGVVYNKPANLTVNDLTNTGATISWTAPEGTPTGYTYQYKEVSDADWSAETSVTATSVALSGLEPARAYMFRVKAVYGTDGASGFTSINFTTDCDVITTFPWSEDFEGYATGNFNGDCWTNEHISGNGTKIFAISTDGTGDNNTHKLQLPDMYEDTKTKLVLPAMNLDGNYQFVLDVYRSNNTFNDTYANEGIRVFVSADGEIDGATEVGFIPREYNVSSSIIPAETAVGWYTYELPIPMTGTCHLILRGESQYCTGTYMDNFVVEVANSCQKPVALKVSNVANHTATIGWTSLASEWVVAYKTAADEDFTEVTTTQNPYVLTNLAAETTYTVKVRTSCGGGDYSKWTSTVDFTTNIAAPVPTDVSVSNVTTKTAAISWNGDATSFNVRYKAASAEEWQTTTATASPITITGLTLETTYQVQVQANYGELDGLSEWTNAVTFTTLTQYSAPADIVANNVKCNSASVSWTGNDEVVSYNIRYKKTPMSQMAVITLKADNVWNDGSGYQMLIDADATAYGTTFPMNGALTSSGDASEETYAEFEYKVPRDADWLLTTTHMLCDSTATIVIPAGTYDWCITNPTPNDRMWIAASNGTVGGRADNYVFEAGKKYEFHVYISGENDAVDVTISSLNTMDEENDTEEWTVVNNVTNPYTIEGLTPNTVYSIEVQAVYADGASTWFAGNFTTNRKDLELANDATDNATLVETYNGKVVNVTLTGRTLYKDGYWNTICLPFDVEIEGSVLEGAVARTLTAASVTDNETIGQTLHLTFGDEVTDSLKAGVPYIIKWEEGDNITDPVFPGVTISNTYEGFDNGEAGDYRVRFLGTYDKMVYGKDKSVLLMGSNNNLYYPDGEEQVTLGACRAYFKIGENNAVNAKGFTRFVIDFGEETTAIHDAEVIMQNGNADAWYTVDGIRLSGKPSKKGMYINNGKKVVVE